MKVQPPLPPLQYEQGLEMSARDHGIDLGKCYIEEKAKMELQAILVQMDPTLEKELVDMDYGNLDQLGRISVTAKKLDKIVYLFNIISFIVIDCR